MRLMWWLFAVLLLPSCRRECSKTGASPLKLGNWNDQRKTGGVAIRHLSGAMDEFALWDRVLGDAEIAALAK